MPATSTGMPATSTALQDGYTRIATVLPILASRKCHAHSHTHTADTHTNEHSRMYGNSCPPQMTRLMFSVMLQSEHRIFEGSRSRN